MTTTTGEGSIHSREGFPHFLTVYGFFSGFFIILEIGWLLAGCNHQK
jgi:hypothetical protein